MVSVGDPDLTIHDSPLTNWICEMASTCLQTAKQLIQDFCRFIPLAVCRLSLSGKFYCGNETNVMKKLLFFLLLFLLGVNGALFWQNSRAEGHTTYGSSCPFSKKANNSTNAVLVPGTFLNIN